MVQQIMRPRRGPPRFKRPRLKIALKKTTIWPNGAAHLNLPRFKRPRLKITSKNKTKWPYGAAHRNLCKNISDSPKGAAHRNLPTPPRFKRPRLKTTSKTSLTINTFSLTPPTCQCIKTQAARKIIRFISNQI